MYLVIVEGSYWASGYDARDPGYTQTYDFVKTFDSEEHLTRYLVGNYSSKTDKVKRIFSGVEMKVDYKVCLELTQ